MRYRDPNLRSLLAGEYVLGTLHGGARRRFERLLERDPVLRGEVENWEAALLPLAEALPEHPPPDRVWQRIRSRIEPLPESPAPGLWHSLRFWRSGALLATACALLLAVGLGFQVTRPPEIRYVAVIADSEQRSAWLITATPQRATLEVRTLQPQTLAGDRSFELWLLPGAGEPPRSLGLLGPASRSTRALPSAVADLLPAGSGLAVSLEPSGGSPTGQPTGPVLYQGPLLRL